MSLRRWGITALLAVAGLAFWLLLAGPSELLGFDTGQAGTALLVAVAWVVMWGCLFEYAASAVLHWRARR